MAAFRYPALLSYPKLATFLNGHGLTNRYLTLFTVHHKHVLEFLAMSQRLGDFMNPTPLTSAT